MTGKKKILVCPLDWGIGHAARCVPVIRELTSQGAEVLIGASNRPLAFLKKEFPNHNFIDFPGYKVTYPQDGSNMALMMVKQFPLLLKSVRKEQKLLKGIIVEHQIDGVISDNRFGLYSSEIPSVFISHQIFIQAPGKYKFLEPILAGINHRYINKYHECWIPDYEEENNLSGALAHKKALPSNFHFIGLLSRFSESTKNNMGMENEGKGQDALVVISGPEPQRSILEEIILTEIESGKSSISVVLGRPESNEKQLEIGNSVVYPHLETEELQLLIQNAKMIISRSGYSTIMDLAATGKKALLIPTPGQTEQEYLARYLKEKGIFNSKSQAQFTLHKALSQSSQYSGIKTIYDNSKLVSRITNLLQMI